jgi:hypothetical protein
MALPITILRQSHQTALTPTGTVQRFVRVDFQVGDDGPFNVSIPETEFSADALLSKVRAVADQVELLRTTLTPPK